MPEIDNDMGVPATMRHSRSTAAQLLTALLSGFSTAPRHFLVHAPKLRYQRFENAKISALGPVKPYFGPATGYFTLRFFQCPMDDYLYALAAKRVLPTVSPI
jgi:hypothetical protein